MNSEPTHLDLARSVEPRQNVLPLRSAPCPECPVNWGMYKELSDAFRLMPHDEQLTRSQDWVCHYSRHQACRGHANNIGLTW